MVVSSYPFPVRNAAYPDLHSILFTDGFAIDNPIYKEMQERAEGDEAKTWRFQYLSMEEELERAFRYVSPCDANSDVFSIKFAEIIRSAANSYEIMAKELYSKLYNDSDKLNIYNYLALDIYLQLANQRIRHLAAFGGFPKHPEVEQPFAALTSWNKMSVIASNHTPQWWNAYNAIKHSNAGLRTHATLGNAMAVVAALFLIIERVFWFGVLQGGWFDGYSPKPNTKHFCVAIRWGRLFART